MMRRGGALIACAALVLAVPPLGAQPAVGASAAAPGENDAPRQPASLAEAEADHAETLRKCGLLQVAAVREECERNAAATLQRQRLRFAATAAASAARR